MTAKPETCGVCGELEPDRRMLRDCFRCGALYHLNPYSNRPGKDCGDAVLGEEFGLHYYCQPCLEAMDAEFRGAASSAGSSGDQGAQIPGLPPRPERPRTGRRYRRVDRR